MEVPPNFCNPMMTKWQLLSKEEGGGQHNNDLGRRSPWWGWRKEGGRGVGGGAPAPKFSATKLYDCDVCLVALPSPRRRLKGRSVETPTIE